MIASNRIPVFKRRTLGSGKLCMWLEEYVQPKELFRGTKDDFGERQRFLATILLQMDLGNVDTRKMEVFVNM